MAAAADAAAARYPQAISLEDPMFGATGSPRIFGDHEMDSGYRVEVSQKYPWPGKLRLRGENAAAEARAAGQDVEDMRLQLAQSARDAFADYYLAARGLAVNKEALDLLASIQSDQETLFKTGKIQEQDLLQTRVEIGRQRQRQLELERMLQVARARINTLLHLPPDAPLPPPPEQVPAGGPLPDEAALAPWPWPNGRTSRRWPSAWRPSRRRWRWPTRSIAPTSRSWRPTTTSGRNGRCGRNSPCG